MTDDEAEAKRKPRVLPHNGAIVCWLPYPWQRWSITDGRGVYQGMRPTCRVACEFAATLPGRPQVPTPEPTLSRSERATGYWGDPEPGRVPLGVPREERRDFDFSKPSPGAPEPVQRDPLAESRAASRRQALAHDRVYGRHRR
jgi:hypothetical protein